MKKIKFCPNCGTSLSENVENFCSICGMKIENKTRKQDGLIEPPKSEKKELLNQLTYMYKVCHYRESLEKGFSELDSILKQKQTHLSNQQNELKRISNLNVMDYTYKSILGKIIVKMGIGGCVLISAFFPVLIGCALLLFAVWSQSKGGPPYENTLFFLFSIAPPIVVGIRTFHTMETDEKNNYTYKIFITFIYSLITLVISTCLSSFIISPMIGNNHPIFTVVLTLGALIALGVYTFLFIYDKYEMEDIVKTHKDEDVQEVLQLLDSVPSVISDIAKTEEIVETIIHDKEVIRHSHQDYIKTSNYTETVSFIPDKNIRTTTAISMLYYIIQTGRADNKKELLNKYDSLVFQNNMKNAMNLIHMDLEKVQCSIDSGFESLVEEIEYASDKIVHQIKVTGNQISNSIERASTSTNETIISATAAQTEALISSQQLNFDELSKNMKSSISSIPTLNSLKVKVVK